MTVKPHVAVRKRSVCDLVRLGVRPVNSDFDIFIRILPYLNNKWLKDARKLSRPRHGHVYTKTTGSSEAWSIFFSRFSWAVRAQTTVTKPTLRASFEVTLCPILKTSTPLRRPRMACSRESKEKWLRDGRSKLADASPLTARKEKRQWLGLLRGLCLKSIFVRF